MIYEKFKIQRFAKKVVWGYDNWVQLILYFFMLTTSLYTVPEEKSIVFGKRSEIVKYVKRWIQLNIGKKL